jgi:hypothetical protein
VGVQVEATKAAIRVVMVVVVVIGRWEWWRWCRSHAKSRRIPHEDLSWYQLGKHSGDGLGRIKRSRNGSISTTATANIIILHYMQQRRHHNTKTAKLYEPYIGDTEYSTSRVVAIIVGAILCGSGGHDETWRIWPWPYGDVGNASGYRR